MRTRSHQIIYYLAECMLVRARMINQNKKPITDTSSEQKVNEGKVETVMRLRKMQSYDQSFVEAAIKRAEDTWSVPLFEYATSAAKHYDAMIDRLCVVATKEKMARPTEPTRFV